MGNWEECNEGLKFSFLLVKYDVFFLPGMISILYNIQNWWQDWSKAFHRFSYTWFLSNMATIHNCSSQNLWMLWHISISF